MLRLTATDFYTYFCPSKCELRIYLKSIGMLEGPPGPFAEILFKLGDRHEKAHLATFPEYADHIHFLISNDKNYQGNGLYIAHKSIIRSIYG
jgi:hypothetical protein